MKDEYDVSNFEDIPDSNEILQQCHLPRIHSLIGEGRWWEASHEDAHVLNRSFSQGFRCLISLCLEHCRRDEVSGVDECELNSHVPFPQSDMQCPMCARKRHPYNHVCIAL